MLPLARPPAPLHPELLALLAGCRSAPADDTARLVLADWLEENADGAGPDGPADARARAELLRVQVELARPSNDAAHVAQLRASEARLLSVHAAKWLGDLPLRLQALRPNRFGFSQHPLVAAQLTQFDPLSVYNAWRFTRGLLTVELNPNELGDLELGAWFASPLGAWVEEASVALGGVEALERLNAAPGLRPYLGVLYAVGVTSRNAPGLTPPGTPYSSHPERLTEKVCRRLLKSRNFAHVRKLTIHPGAVEVGFVRFMVNADLSGVRWLEVKAPVGDEGAAFLTAAPLVNLSALDVSGCDIGAGGLKTLANSPHLGRLVSLVAYRNSFGCDGLAALAASPLAQTLNVLEVQNTGLGDRGLAALIASQLLNRLLGPGLNLSMNPMIGDAGVAALADSPHLARFTELILRDCRVSDAGAEALAGSPHVEGLTYLDLWSNRIGDVGAQALAESDRLANLRLLSLRDNLVTPGGASALQSRFGDRVKV